MHLSIYIFMSYAHIQGTYEHRMRLMCAFVRMSAIVHVQCLY